MIWEWLAQYPTPMCRGNLLFVLLTLFASGCVVGTALVGMVCCLRRLAGLPE